MISVTIELDQFGHGENVCPLVVIGIANVGTGNHDHGDYRYAVSHDASIAETPTAKQLLRGEIEPWKSGTVVGFPRRLGSAKLLARVLADAFPREVKR